MGILRNPRSDLQQFREVASETRKKSAVAKEGAAGIAQNVADEAGKLGRAIDGRLRAAGAADFTFLEAACPVKETEAKWSAWLLQLRLLKEAATWAENVEKEGIRAVSNNSDPMRDDFVEHLMRIWERLRRPDISLRAAVSLLKRGDRSFIRDRLAQSQ